jgi:hypothetical protein
LIDEVRRANERHRYALLAAARVEATSRGKEPFDRATLEQLCPEVVRAWEPDELEHLYYVRAPRVMTLHELAAALRRSRCA